MTNLSDILQTYFIDTMVDEIVESIGNTKPNSLDQGMDENLFNKYFLKHNARYGTDVVSCIHEYANSYWLSYGGNSGKSVFNILRHATENILHWDDSGENPVCRYNEFLKWNDISSRIGEDIFTTSFLANKSVNENHLINSFAWKPHIIADSKEVNEIIQKGLHELHFHMYGSSLCFAINWIAAMNDCSQIYKKKKDLNDFCDHLTEDIIKAAAIRIFLFDILFSTKLGIQEKNLSKILQAHGILETSSLFREFSNQIRVARSQDNVLKYDKFIFDYALTRPISENDIQHYYNIPLVSERKFLYTAFHKIYSDNKTFAPYKTYFYIYLVVKNKARQFFVQDNQTKGFSRFNSYDHRKSYFIKDGSKYWDIFCFVSAQTTACNQSMKGLEMRIVPKLNAQEQAKEIKSINASVNSPAFMLGQDNLILQNKQRLGYILHFIKEEDKDSDKIGAFCRNEKIRDKLDKQGSAIYTLVKKNSMYTQGGIIPQRKLKEKEAIYPIIGIDAANSEFNCRPEVFATVFRKLKYINHNNKSDYLYSRKNFQLGRTFHVAEDYYDIVDGLRAIDESVYFLNFGEGDRLGHCVALGIEPQQYYKTRNYTIILPKQNLLDNAVWFLSKMEEYSIPDSNGLKKRLRDVFHLYFPQIYKGYRGTLEDYYSAWKLRGDDPRSFAPKDSRIKRYLLNKIDPELDILRENEVICNLYKAYHSYDQRISGEELVEYQLKDSDVWVIQELQQHIRKEISHKKISIETNPTSNIIITDVERYSKHPILQFYNYGLSEDSNPNQINVSINTDDQGVFATSLEKEFTLMACALEKKRNNEDGKATYEPNDIYNWLDDIRRSASRNTFFKE